MSKYSAGFECDECPEVYDSALSAEMCCGTGDYCEGYQCHTCKTIHPAPSLAAECCPGRVPKAEPVVYDPSHVKISVEDLRTVRPPDPNCEYCGIAQALGTVISCRCMK